MIDVIVICNKSVIININLNYININYKLQIILLIIEDVDIIEYYILLQFLITQCFQALVLVG